MKIAKFPVRFKQTKSMTAKNISAPSNFDQEFESIEVEDVINLDPIHVANVLNDFTQNYIKKLIAAKIHSDHDFRPKESDLNFASAYEDFISPSKRGNRILSVENIKLFNRAYEIYLAKLNKDEKQIRMHQEIIQCKFDRIASNKKILDVFAAIFVEFELNDSESNFNESEIEIINSVYESLNEKLIQLIENHVSEITEDSL